MINKINIKNFLILFTVTSFIFLWEVKKIFNFDVDLRLLVFILFFFIFKKIYLDIKQKKYLFFIYLLSINFFIITHYILTGYGDLVEIYTKVLILNYTFAIAFYYHELILENKKIILSIFLVIFFSSIFLNLMYLPENNPEPHSCGAIKGFFWNLPEKYYLVSKLVHYLSSYSLLFKENSHLAMGSVPIILYAAYLFTHEAFKTNHLLKIFLILFIIIILLKTSATLFVGMVVSCMAFVLFDNKRTSWQFVFLLYFLSLLSVQIFFSDKICVAKIIPPEENYILDVKNSELLDRVQNLLDKETTVNIIKRLDGSYRVVDEATSVAEGNSTLATENNSTLATENNSTIATENNSTIATENNSTIATENNSTIATENNSTIATENNSTIATENNSTLATENNSTIATENNSTIATENNSTTSSKEDVSLLKVSDETMQKIRDIRNLINDIEVNERNPDENLVSNLADIHDIRFGSLSSMVFFHHLTITRKSILDRPFGWGFNNYSKAVDHYNNQLVLINGYIGNLNKQDGTNNFFKIIIEFGFFGLFFYFAFFLCFLSKKISIENKIFLFPFILTQSIRGAGYFNGGFLLILFIICIIQLKKIKKR